MSVFQALRRALTTKTHGAGMLSGHIPVHTTRPFRHVPVIEKHYRGDPQLRREQNAPHKGCDVRGLDLEGDLLTIRRGLRGLGYRDSAVRDPLLAAYGASREMRWALKDVERKLNEQSERRKAEDLEQELNYYRAWDKRRTVSDYTS